MQGRRVLLQPHRSLPRRAAPSSASPTSLFLPPRRRLGRLLLIGSLGLTIAALGAPPSVALAQQRDDITPERVEQARKLMEVGQAAYVERRYLDAAQAFQKAYTLQPFPAFLFNEGVCHEKLGDIDRAIDVFKRYVAADPNAPDASAIKTRLERLEKERSQRAALSAENDAQTDASESSKQQEVMRSLVLVESDPPGAPAQLWQKSDLGALAFREGGENKGWSRIAAGKTPLAVTASPGQFHVIVDKWRAYNRSASDVEVYAGRVHQLKLNLSQGDFMAFLRVTSPIDHATIYIDDPPPHEKKPWGFAPHGEMIEAGKHTLWVEAPGYETFEQTLTLEAGQQKELPITLDRVSYGFLSIDGNAALIKVMVDGEPRGLASSEDGPLRLKASKGKHLIRAEAPGKKPFEAEIDVPAGQSRAVHIVFFDKPSRALGWGAAIGSAAAFGAGYYLGTHSNDEYDALSRDREQGRLIPDDRRADRGKLYAYGANGGFILGGVLAGVSLYGFLRDPHPDSGARVEEPEDLRAGPPRRKSAHNEGKQNLSLAPVISPQSQGLTLSGAF